MDHEGTELVEAYDYLFKFIVIGEAGTGKSCLLYHCINDSFKEHSTHTIGVEFSSRTLRIGDRNIKLQLWDTAGQERFRSVTRSYYRGAAGALLVYDITSRRSFVNLDKWLADCRALASPHLVVVLVGNKLDREDEREVAYTEGSRWAEENGRLGRKDQEADGRSLIRRSIIAQWGECYSPLFVGGKDDPVCCRRWYTGSRREWDGCELWRETIESSGKQLAIKRRVWGGKEEEEEKCQPRRDGG